LCIDFLKAVTIPPTPLMQPCTIIASRFSFSREVDPTLRAERISIVELALLSTGPASTRRLVSSSAEISEVIGCDFSLLISRF
jgi:hypothetical protein